MSIHSEVQRIPPALTGDQLADQIATELGGSLNPRRAALQLVNLIQRDLADWAMVVLPDRQTGAMMLVGDAAPTGVQVGRAYLVGRALDRVLRAGGFEHIEGTDLSGLVPAEPFLQSAAELVPAEVVGVGLTARGVTFGALVLLRRADAGFTVAEIGSAQRVADRAALVLDSARMYHERMHVASVLQQSLRPPALPDIPGLRLAACYRPAAEHLDIGGDFYDVIGGDDDWLVAFGDVCGKGVEAAALTGLARQSIRTAAHFDRDPAAVLGVTNSVLYNPASTQFVTVLCARLRPDGTDVQVDLATAGHTPPLVLRIDGRVEEVAVYGTAAAIVAEVQYGTTTFRLAPGDTMLMFTDGVDEAWGSAGQYGLERLQNMLPAYAGAPPEVVCEAVEQDVMEYLDGTAHDDIALLAVTCGP
ncbi:PP2C family protein-serine/threonine phosphatase [[Mycobacterium] wendilense]|uniref:PP2C family protein-serine/threonine phosphatase n=1 Tax=[Mycobacterium] wendilense TaxID=3064284 RepID=A0ABM9M7U3_9MYCO|nr:PP2C family protein-serine/threonine phosphatase [Mycolicibacterium sp. MU0050]CAJ1578334.1 PP2C family protein-serine/threonine phosphatase [Mycolicibacterium sp. MU0050]